MTTSSSTPSVTCPHCGAANVAGASFCEACGKALPSSVASGPRVVSPASAPMTAAGHSLVSDELRKQMKKASTALLIVAILQTLIGPVMVFVEKNRMERAAPPGTVFEIQPWVWLIVFGIAAAFWILYFWARRSPLPAAIAGLVLFVTMHLLDAVLDPASLARGWLIKIVIVVMLVQAIQAGINYRKLSEGRPAAG